MMRFVERCAVVLLVGVLSAPAGAKMHFRAHRKKPLKVQIAKLLADPAVTRAHWGIAVAGMDGTPIYSMNEAQFFQPASNAKLFTTAAAIALLGANTTYETNIVGEGVFDGATRLTGNLTLVGAGDANLSGRTIPYVPPAMRPNPPLPAPAPLRYLEEMADQVAATGLKVVNGDIVGDDTLFPWEPYAADWSIDDMVWGYGAPVSALTINDNQIQVTVTPGATPGVGNGSVVLNPAVPAYYTVDSSQLVTGMAQVKTQIAVERALGTKVLRVFGGIGVGAAPEVEEVAIHDPAEYAAMALKEMLEARGIRVTGTARAQHGVPSLGMGFLQASTGLGDVVGKNLAEGRTVDCNSPAQSEDVSAVEERPLARHASVALKDDLVVTNKTSQNLHAELFLHHLGLKVACGGSTANGAGVVRGFLTGVVGIDKDDFVFYDGSGLSGHDLVTPRATVRLLQYASAQPWFADWKASLPVGGEDGTLAFRFAKAPLKDHLFAKTGTLGEARALSGYVDCASGRTVIFSIMVGNHAPGTHADEGVMDKIVAAIAATN